MIKLKDLLSEASFTKKRDFGNQKYWTVTKSFTADTPTGEYKGTGQHYGGHGRGSQELQKAVRTKLDVKKGMELQALPGAYDNDALKVTIGRESFNIYKGRSGVLAVGDSYSKDFKNEKELVNWLNKSKAKYLGIDRR